MIVGEMDLNVKVYGNVDDVQNGQVDENNKKNVTANNVDPNETVIRMSFI